MSRLIDADAFKKENERLLHCDFPYLSEATLEELIDEAPTVDAVPISFIEKKIESIRQYLKEHEGEAFNEGLISRAVAYRKLIEDWMSERV